VVGLLFQFSSIDDLDLAENLCDPGAHVLHKECRREQRKRDIGPAHSYFSSDLYMNVKRFFIHLCSRFLSTKFSRLLVVIYVIYTNACDTVPLKGTALVNKFWLVTRVLV